MSQTIPLTALTLQLSPSAAKISSKALLLEISSVEDLSKVEVPSVLKKRVREHLKKAAAKKHFWRSPVEIGAAEELIIAFQGASSEEEYVRALSEEIRSVKQDSLTFIAEDTQALNRLDLLVLARYQYTPFLSKRKERSDTLVVVGMRKPLAKVLSERVEDLKAVYLARDLVNCPPSSKNPEILAKFVKGMKFRSTKVSVMSKRGLEKLGCNLLLAVGQGSEYDPQMITFEKKSKKKGVPTLALVGKGITFDAGGLQIKPGNAMLDMKCDMSGAAAVLAAFHRLDSEKDLGVNLVGAIALAENMLGDEAYKPLDIIRGYNGMSVEIHHTDAEGRLVLADAAAYIDEKMKPDALVTIATLTGAQMVALGYNYAGVISRDGALVEALQNAGDRAHEAYWPLPIDSHIEESLKAKIADLKNIADGVKAGASVGAAFISKFVKNARYTHLDIAGPAYLDRAHEYRTAGGTGFGTLTFIELIRGGLWISDVG